MKIGMNRSRRFLSTKLANNGKYAALDQAVISLSNFAASILLARLVSPTELGAYVTGFLAIYFVRAVQNGLIIQPLNALGAVKSEGAFKGYFTAVFFSSVDPIRSIRGRGSAVGLDFDQPREQCPWPDDFCIMAGLFYVADSGILPTYVLHTR